MKVNEKLFDAVRISLDYEEVDTFATQKINQYITRGKQLLRMRAPDLTDENFSDERSLEHTLLLDYCRYANSNATEEFVKNYSAELLSLRQSYEVRAFGS